MSTALVWFRNDLRVIDHAPLLAATQGNEVLAVYCFDPRQFSKTGFGFPKTGGFRSRFLIQCVEDLREQLRCLGGELVVRFGKPEDMIGQLSDTLRIESLHYHAEVGTEEQRVQRSVEEMCRQREIHVHRHQGHSLLNVDDLPFSVSETPELFTTFRKIVEAKSKPRETQPAPLTIPTPSDVGPGRLIEPGKMISLSDVEVETPAEDPRALNVLSGGQTAGLARLKQYVWTNDRLRIYKTTRNGMLHPDDSSKFSAWLAHGCLSPRMIADEVRRYERERDANESTYWMIFELLWRDYFRLIMAKHGSRLFQVGGLQQFTLPWKQDRDLWQHWCDGTTGYPLIDANMQELASTGYMSNRGRQNVASFLTKNLGLDWRMGAQWFESLLIDYDVASNYGNWNYAAGVGNDARGFRYFNVIKQSRDYDVNGDYLRHWLPALQKIPAPSVHEPWKLSTEQQREFGCRIGADYPGPIVELVASARENEARYLATPTT